MKTLSITIEESLLRGLDRGIREASLGGRSEAIREAIRGWLKRMELRKKVQKEIKGYRRRPVRRGEFDFLLSAQEWPE